MTVQMLTNFVIFERSRFRLSNEDSFNEVRKEKNNQINNESRGTTLDKVDTDVISLKKKNDWVYKQIN